MSSRQGGGEWSRRGFRDLVGGGGEMVTERGGNGHGEASVP